ncbi:vanadium-dependent haloperoxidase [Runella aurantiaca]|uniref:Vanadium chloroperoxidase N-terminal domain-containing protein n=1 Tax=Runella aurantiaca TaxID=2282308 RepID=A0A369ICE3_9BACT|nr:vanadium-dependent haloperoxidase [Runella aurantiaca]RDB06540.1 hypothetical protein DVG78_07300 [Runella aurantiaca]
MNSILYWNEVALEANRVSHTNGKQEQTGPTLSSRALAMVHLAMYDAYAGVINNIATHPMYQAGAGIAPAGASYQAAVAAAAHFMLGKLFPSQKSFFDGKYQQAGLTGNGLIEGRDYGVKLAGLLWEERKSDPDASDLGYSSFNDRGRHRPDPDNPKQGYHAPFYGKNSKCFSSDRYELDAPPQPGTASYTQALKEVKGKGIAPELMGTLPAGISKRKVDETIIGIYWGYDGAVGLGTPPRLYNQIVREVSIKKNDGKPEEEAEASDVRLFALVNVAMADAGILAWEQKYKHDFWRPVLGIREHDPSMGPGAAVGDDDILNDTDPEWLPFGAPSTNAMNKPQEHSSAYPCQQISGSNGIPKNFTPPFPAYPSGHATFGAAALHMTRMFYEIDAENTTPDTLFDDMTFVSEEMNGVNTDNKGTIRPRHVRKFSGGLWQMIEENGRSRVYLGVHWIFDAFAVDEDGNPDFTQNIGGVPLGLNIAKSIYGKGGGKGPVKA